MQNTAANSKMPSRAAGLCTMGLAGTAFVTLHRPKATPVRSQICTTDTAARSDADFLKAFGGAGIAMTGSWSAAFLCGRPPGDLIVGALGPVPMEGVREILP